MAVILTFKPLSGGRFRCNQNGIVTKNCENIRKRFNPRNMSEKIMMEHDGDWNCPKCGRVHYNGYVGLEGKCSYCKTKVIINGAKPKPKQWWEY